MRRSERIEKIIVYMTAVLLCMTLVSLWMISNLYARYSTTTEGEDSARVAVFGHGETITLNNEMTDWVPGDATSYNLTVSNKKGAEISEVSVRYNVEIVTAGNLPLVYTLKDAEGNAIGEYTESADISEHVFDNNSMVFESNKADEQKYTLDVTWPGEKKDEALNGVPDFIQVNINVEQID